MKKFYILALAATMFAACTTDKTQDLQPMDTPETLTVGFEGGDDNTRVQLNSAGKTVWTEGDLVSVFYRSDANQKWQFQGETGERTGLLKRVSTPEATITLSDVVVAYPYSEEYYINPKTCNIQAYLPDTQSYLKDSFGLDGNLMVSAGEYNQIYLKNVCGWLKLQLTGEGEMVQSITLKGNNGEQVAGSIYVDTETATATLAAETNGGYEDGVGGTLVFDDAILTEVTLNCGNGVELGAEPTAFYIALPPQTFEKGLTVEIETAEGKIMGQYTDKEIVIERNTIQPMAALEFEEKVAANQIRYTSSNGEIVTPNASDVFGANIVSNTYDKEAGYGTITFDGKVTSIGWTAFRKCPSLTSITIPESVTSIGDYAFYSCTSLKEFYGKFASEDNRCLIVNSVLDSFAPAGIISYTIPDSVTSIGISAFQSCTSLTSVNIPDSVTEIGVWAFSYCTSLTSITIPDSVTSIGDKTFSNCTSLTSVTIPDSVTEIGDSTFYHCDSLTSVNIPNSVTSIGDSTFNYCALLTNVTIPNNVTSIGDYAFAHCTSLTSVTIPDSVTSIGSSAFSHCTSLKAFYGKFASEDNRCLIVNGVLNYFAISCGATSYTIPDSVTEIAVDAFYGCNSLTSVTIPDSVTSIGDYAFYLCDSLTSVNIPDSVTSIGRSAFSGCKWLTSITIPDSVTSIGSSAFSGCKSLTSVTIGNSVTSIGKEVFYGCTSLKEVYCKPTTPPTGGNRMFSYYDGNGSYLPIGCKIYVPASADDSIINAYKAKQYWSDYASYIEEYDFSAGQ